MYFYCPTGTVAPIPCGNGNITLGAGSSSAADCIACPRGYYCLFGDYFSNQVFNPAIIPNAKNNLTVYGPCDPGFVCIGGASLKEPIDNVTGYICPTGHYCLQGAFVETPCPAGKYNDQLGQTTCITCPVGSICNTIGMTSPIPCTPGSYCPSASIRGVPCPPGTYNNITNGMTLSDCLACPPGQFCDTWGLNQPAGPCAPGFICVSGSTTPTPFWYIYALGSSLNGQCPIGNYCPSGALSPIQCQAGTYNPNTGQGQCTQCPKGQYCQGQGLTSPTGQCYEGFFCDVGSTTPNPVACDPIADGYCPPGAVEFSTCPDGFFLNSNGLCQDCPNGKECTDGTVVQCPALHYCSDNINHPYGQLCPNGTYSNTLGLTAVSQCVPCPAKQYCVAGKQIDVCDAGYICLYGANSPTPYNTTGAFACPLGFYCSPGVSQPSICPLGMYTFQPGAIQVQQCDFCKEGFYCEYGSITPLSCPQGNYCPLGSQDPTNCSVTRYNPNIGGSDYSACVPCKSGYYCYEPALGDLFSYGDQFRCPLGNYCPPATWRPYPCAAGTYADSSMRFPPGSLADCGQCPQHYYCPQMTPNQYNFSCWSGTFCPAGSTWPTLCPAGQYCQQTADPITGLNVITISPCQQGYYCPLGTPVQIKCGAGEVCSAGSSFPSKTLLQSNTCVPGQYFGYGTCNPCIAGFVCQNNTNTKYPVYLAIDGGYECPAGFYCPSGSSTPTPCPEGTYRSSKKGKQVADCSACPPDSYSGLIGQIACTLCGRGSTGDPSSNSSCICLGNYRLWRESDNQCVCSTGYSEPAVPTVAGATSTDSQDCEPIVQSTCASGSHYDSSSNGCVSDSVCQASTLCNGQGSTAGFYSASAQQCMCSNADSSPNSICNSQCRANSLQAYLIPSGLICLSVPAKNQSQCYNQSVFGSSLYLGGLSCPSGQCPIATQGSYEAASIFVAIWQQNHNYTSTAATTNSTTRMLQLATQSPSTIICALPNNPVSFTVSHSHFPVYMKDSPYNTNQNFDSGLFDVLSTKLLQANMNITTFMFTFVSEGVYTFGDYSNPQTSVTIVKVSASACSVSQLQGASIYPLTSTNLAKFSIAPAPFLLQVLPEWLIAIPIVFIILTFLSTFLQYLWESRIERQEYELRMKRAGHRKNFQNDDGKLDKRQYLADLYKLIKDNMDEVTRMIHAHDNKANLLKLLKDKTSLINELGEGGKQTVSELKQQLKGLLEQLRFPDGSTLKELLVHKELQKKMQKTLDKENQDDGNDDELDIDALERRTVSGDNSEEESDEDDEASDVLADAVRQSLAKAGNADSDDERQDDKKKDGHQRDIEMQRQLRIKREQDRRKDDFKDRICDLIDDENDRDKLIDGFEDKMRSLDNMIKNENQRQQDNLADKLAGRRNRKKEALAQVDELTGEKQQRIENLEMEKQQLQEELEDVLEHGMKDPQLQKVAQKEKEAAMEKLEKQMLEKQDMVRQEYLGRLKNAKTDKEKERIVDEMQRRLQSVEEELAREKAEQERNLERILLLRQQKRVKKLAHDHQKEIDSRDKEIKELSTDIDKERARLYVEHGGDLLEVMDDQFKEKAVKLIDKSLLAQTTNLDLDKSDLEQIEILKVQLKLEKDHALNAVEKEIEDSSELDRARMEEDLKNKSQKQKDEFNQLIRNAKNETERAKLIQDSKLMEQRIEDEMQNERLRQERLLEEKRNGRKNLRKVKEIELEQKQMAEVAKKETELLQRKYDKLMGDHAVAFEKDMSAAVGTYERRGNSDKALLLVNQTSNELLEKKLRLLINKQFFELEKYLGTMYNQTALQRMAAKEKSRARFKQAEEEAYSTLGGDALVNRLNQLKELEKTENESIEGRFKQQEKEQETEIRERLEQKFFEERTKVMEEDQKKREELINGIVERDQSGSQIQDIAAKLLKVNQEQNQEELTRMEKDKEESMERIKLQIVAENEAEVQQLQKTIEELMAREKEIVEQRMKQKRDEVMGEKKKNLEDRIKEMSGQLSEFQKDQIMKQFMLELNNLEKAIAVERDNQLAKMRQRLIKKKIEAERLKKQEQQDQRVQAVKKQIGQYLLAMIKSKRLQAEEAKKAKVVKKEVAPVKPLAKPTSSQQKKRPTSSQMQKVAPVTAGEQVMSAKDQLRLLLQQWSERVKEKQLAGDDKQQIWEKRTIDTKLSSPKSSVSKLSKMFGLHGLNAARNNLNNSSLMQSSTAANANYTMEELMMRIRRIERLTENMSQGKFEVEGPQSPQTRKAKEGGGSAEKRLLTAVAEIAGESGSHPQLPRKQGAHQPSSTHKRN